MGNRGGSNVYRATVNVLSINMKKKKEILKIQLNNSHGCVFVMIVFFKQQRIQTKLHSKIMPAKHMPDITVLVMFHRHKSNPFFFFFFFFFLDFILTMFLLFNLIICAIYQIIISKQRIIHCFAGATCKFV